MGIESLVGTLLVIGVVGALTYLILQLPMAPPFKTVIVVVALLVVLLWLVRRFVPGAL